ncbi:MAG: phage tail protein [Candidatus Aminicenantes bacterium]|nr:phage tail protein [Candidatus Aminicenantes bacterium]
MNENNFFIINTVPLWAEGVQDGNILIGDEGITLNKSSDYTYEDTIIPPSVEPVSLDRDACGVLYILDRNKKNVLLFDIKNKYSRWMTHIPFENPVSIAIDEFDLYIVDAVGTGEWKLYCAARVNGQMRREMEIPLEVRIASCGDGLLYVLDVNNQKVFKTGWQWDLQEVVTDLEGAADIASDRDANIYILQPEKRDILMFAKDGNFKQSLSIPFEPGAKFLNLAVESSDHIFLGFAKESSTGWGILQLTKRLKYAISGTYTGKVFDSTQTGCRWSKLILDADIPANTRVTLSYAASDDEPGPAGPYARAPIVNPTDALLRDAVGRYIRFKIELYGDENGWAAPLIRSLKIFFPMVTYLRYLPEIYQENEESSEFLERFLLLFETFLAQKEGQAFQFTQYMDPGAAPNEFIHWLSSWLAIAYDENWPMDKKRQLIRWAPELYKKRGTPWTLSRLMEFFSGIKPVIIEPFHLKCIDKNNEEYKELVGKLYGSGSYRFTVLVPPNWEDPGAPVKKAKQVTEAERGVMQRIIDTEKPAHTVGCLQVLEPWFNLDRHTYLEINTVLTKPQFILEKTSVLARDTAIYEKEPGGRVGEKSRADIDSILT